MCYLKLDNICFVYPRCKTWLRLTSHHPLAPGIAEEAAAPRRRGDEEAAPVTPAPGTPGRHGASPMGSMVRCISTDLTPYRM